VGKVGELAKSLGREEEEGSAILEGKPTAAAAATPASTAAGQRGKKVRSSSAYSQQWV